MGLQAAPVTPTTLQFSLSIPNAPSLIGGHVYLQAYAFSPGANALGIVISNGGPLGDHAPPGAWSLLLSVGARGTDAVACARTPEPLASSSP
jgi:hypothetical protein